MPFQACYLLDPLIFTWIIIYALIYHSFVNFKKVFLYSKLCSQDEKIKMAKYEPVPDLKNSLIPFLFINTLMDLNKSLYCIILCIYSITYIVYLIS